MNKKGDNTFAYAFLTVVFVLLTGVAFVVTRPNTTENLQEKEVENSENHSNSNTNQDQVTRNKFPKEVIDAFLKINNHNEYRFTSNALFRSYVENEEESSTKIFSLTTQFIFDKDNFKYSITNREGSKKSEQNFTFEDNELFLLKDEGDMVLVEDEGFVSKLISAKDQIKDPNYFFINENDIKSISISEDNGNDLISVELVEDDISKLIDPNIAESIKNYFKVNSVVISANGYEITYVISEESLTREITIDELFVEIDPTRNFSVKNFKTTVKYIL